ncbi:hypothetical protein CR513_62077, partial [Mucuna pruriens]
MEIVNAYMDNVVDESKSQVSRSFGEHRPSQNYSSDEYVLTIDWGDTKCYEETMSHEGNGK